MSFIDLRKNKTFAAPEAVDPNQYPLTEEGIDDLVANELQRTIDFENAPDGRYGIDKIHAWFHDNGLPTNHEATKDELLTEIKRLEQETS